MSSKNGKDDVGQRQGQDARGRRSAKDRERDSAINHAMAVAGDQKGPIIVRIGEKRPYKAKGAPQPKKAKPKEAPSNTAMAEALFAAGVKIEPKPTKVEGREQGRNAHKVKPPKNPEVVASRPEPKRALKPHKKASKRKRVGKGHPVPEERGKQVAKRLKKFLKSLPQTPTPSPEKKSRARQEEIARFIVGIKSATFGDLLERWKRHVAFTEYIRETGHNSDRLESYVRLIGAIEAEWQRRSKLSFTSDEYFDWPTTKAEDGGGKIGEIACVTEGPLGYLGYHVGETSSLRTSERQALLRRFFQMPIPPIESPSYVKSWGPPASAARLKKMAGSIASSVRLRKNQSKNYGLAIAEWESDLDMLYHEFYVAKFGFGWPRV